VIGKLSTWIAVFGAICLRGVSVPCLGAQETAPAAGEAPVLVLHMETREAVLDVIARDSHNLPIANLKADELQVYELPKHGHRISRRILAFRVVDPEQRAQVEESSAGFHVSSGAVCALNATMHYQIAIPASAEPGYHTILVTTSRRHAALTFRRRYYVGLSRTNAAPQELKKLVTSAALQEAACYHPLTPPTLELTAEVLATTSAKATRYAVAIKPESLKYIGADALTPVVQLDFGMCVFDSGGEVIDYLHSSVNHTLNAADLARLPSRGYVNVIEIPGAEAPAMARLVVLDRATGNLGVVDVSRPVPVAVQTGKAKKKPKLIGDVRAFGSVTPSESSFCGDVYELPPGTTSSVSSFAELDPVGSLYTNMLDVPNQDITHMGGIPGITHSSVWFGVDYYGKFYVTTPGVYGFELTSDDGARLEIDNRVLIDLDGAHAVAKGTAKAELATGWHSIHVPYFQGPPVALALVLQIQPPGEAMRPFNLNEFAHAEAQLQK
jgi:hypothetical protein